MLSIGTVINNKYELLEFIAPGGMGEVWRASDKVLDREVAVKMVNANYIKQNPKATDVLLDEAKAGARLLGHPNVVSVLDFGVFALDSTDNYYIVMELVSGMNVNKWIEEVKPLIDPETYYHISLLIALETCRAVGFAHRKGIQHRDIKPLNIFLSDYGITKVGDFGLARFIDAVTRAHTVWDVSSPAYTAPEQWKSEKPTIETDLYQLGCTIYHLLTGQYPFVRPSMASLMYAHLNDVAEEPKNVSPIIPEQLSNIIMQLLNKTQSERVDLWELNDAIASEIKAIYTIKADFSKNTEEFYKTVSKITEIDIDSMRNGEIELDFPDYSEILSEGIELILAGIINFQIINKAAKLSSTSIGQLVLKQLNK